MKKEMTNVSVAFKVLDSMENLPVGYSKLSVHMVFDIKLDLTRKACLVADGHLTPGSCGKSVIFPHLVGFHSSRQNIY